MEESSLHDIAAVVNGILRGTVPTGLCTGAAIDSRALRPNDLFIPLSGQRTDGHRFIKQAQENGAAGFIYASAQASSPCVREALRRGPGIEVEAPLAALRRLGAWNRDRLAVRVTAVTGSNGKTTTKEMIGSILRRRRATFVSPGNKNNEIGLPINLLRIGPEYAEAVLEMGMNHRGEIARLCRLARPHAGVITNVGAAHLEYLGTLENVARAKGELLDALDTDGIAVLNYDDPLVRRIGDEFEGTRIWFGLAEQADVRAEALRMAEGTTRFDLVFPDRERCRVMLNMPGGHNVFNALAAAALAWSQDIPGVDIAAGLGECPPVDGRFEVLQGPGWTVINDCYNANPSSLAAGLETAATMGGKRLIVVLSDMLELGGLSESLHRECGRLAARSGASSLYIWGDYADSYREGALAGGLPSDRVVVCRNREELARNVRDSVTEGDVVLVKASRARSLEMITERLL